jgi:hypothetical protein
MGIYVEHLFFKRLFKISINCPQQQQTNITSSEYAAIFKLFFFSLLLFMCGIHLRRFFLLIVFFSRLNVFILSIKFLHLVYQINSSESEYLKMKQKNFLLAFSICLDDEPEATLLVLCHLQIVSCFSFNSKMFLSFFICRDLF